MSTVAPHPVVPGGPAPELPPHLRDVASDEASLRRFLHGLPGVDPVGVEQRSAGLATRSIKKGSKLAAIDLAISMVDLTTLEGSDTAGKVRTLAAKARRPDPANPDTPHVAALCIYPDMVAVAVAALAGSGVGIASVATAFPTGRTSIEVRLADTAGRRRGRRDRDRHGDRPGRIPLRALRQGLSTTSSGSSKPVEAPDSR